MVLKKRVRYFFKILTNIWSKKIVGKKTCEICFEDSHEYRGKNGGKKTREIYFQDSHVYREQKNGGEKTPENFL